MNTPKSKCCGADIETFPSVTGQFTQCTKCGAIDPIETLPIQPPTPTQSEIEEAIKFWDKTKHKNDISCLYGDTVPAIYINKLITAARRAQELEKKQSELANHVLVEDVRHEYLLNCERRVQELENKRGCLLAKSGRGDCLHFIGYPSPIHIPNQHDGKDDTVDCYGKPNGWCYPCWLEYKLTTALEENKKMREALEMIASDSHAAWYMVEIAQQSLTPPPTPNKEKD